MRRIALLLALAMSLVALSGCMGVDYSDPLHPSTRAPGEGPARCLRCSCP